MCICQRPLRLERALVPRLRRTSLLSKRERDYASVSDKNKAATFSLRHRSLSTAKSKLNRPYRGEAFSQSPNYRALYISPSATSRPAAPQPFFKSCRKFCIGQFEPLCAILPCVLCLCGK